MTKQKDRAMLQLTIELLTLLRDLFFFKPVEERSWILLISIHVWLVRVKDLQHRNKIFVRNTNRFSHEKNLLRNFCCCFAFKKPQKTHVGFVSKQKRVYAALTVVDSRKERKAAQSFSFASLNFLYVNWKTIKSRQHKFFQSTFSTCRILMITFSTHTARKKPFYPSGHVR